MKKFLSILLVAMLSLSLLAGCAKKEEAATETPVAETPAAETPAEETPVAEEPAAVGPSKEVTLTVWEQMDPSAQTTFDEVEAAFEAAYPLVKIERVHYETEDLRTNFLNSAQAGQGPQIIYGPGDNVGPFIKADVIMPVTDVVKSETINALDPMAMDFTKVSGKYYGIPDIFGNNITLLYNKDVVASAPDTWADLVTVAKENTDAANGLYGLLYNEKEPYWFVGFLNGFGGTVLDASYNPTLNTDAMVQALQFVKDIREVDGLGVEGMDYGIADAAFLDGSAAMIFNGAWSWKSYMDAGLNLGIAPAPVLSSGQRVTFYNATKGYSLSKSVDVNDADMVAAINLFFEFFVVNAENNAKFALANSQAPTSMAARELDVIKNDPLQVAEVATLKFTAPMPIVAEMRGIWDSIRPELEAVLYDGKDPKEAAAAMQTAAEEAIKAIRAE